MNAPGKVVSLDEATPLVREAQEAGRRVVMCHGCFDLVHPGHVRHLQQAAKLGDHLIVTVTDDRGVDKGDARPLIPQELRAENLAALDCVDWVAVNPYDTAAELLEHLRPDIYVKGREYEHNDDPRFAAERRTVERAGGRVVFTSGDVVFSSTALMATMAETADPLHAHLRQLMEQHAITPPRVDPIIAAFRGRRVLVVGETLIDTYVLCSRPEIAGESAMMTLRPNEYRRFDGGAAIIARHLAALGARPTLVTGLPRTTRAAEVRTRLENEGIDVRAVELDAALVEKQRFLVGPTKVMKVDLGETVTLDAARHQLLIDLAFDAAAGCEAAIIADFGEGLFTSATLGAICAAVRRRVDLLVGDVSGRRSSLMAMHHMDLLCPSESEVRDALHDYDSGLSEVVWRSLDRTRTRRAIVTLGPEGALAFDRRSDRADDPDGWQSRLLAEHVPSLAPMALDQLGCGDALLAAATLTMLAGGSLVLATVLGSVAAAHEAQQLGNVVITAADLRRGLRTLCSTQLACRTGPAELTTMSAARAAQALR